MYKKGFTLIELLMVVLIIGILSAIALPQYKRAIEKSRYAEIEEMIHNILSAEQRYYLDHGTFTDTFNKLDTDFSISNGVISGNLLRTDNMEISIDAKYIEASRTKGTPRVDLTSVYTIYGDMETGRIFCQDDIEKDDITCKWFGLDEMKMCYDDVVVGVKDHCPDEISSQESCEKNGCYWDTSTKPESCTCKP